MNWTEFYRALAKVSYRIELKAKSAHANSQGLLMDNVSSKVSFVRQFPVNEYSMVYEALSQKKSLRSIPEFESFWRDVPLTDNKFSRGGCVIRGDAKSFNLIALRNFKLTVMWNESLLIPKSLDNNIRKESGESYVFHSHQVAGIEYVCILSREIESVYEKVLSAITPTDGPATDAAGNLLCPAQEMANRWSKRWFMKQE